MPSRPGYPIVVFADDVYYNHYYRASDGVTFDGTSTANYREWFTDASGLNTPNWPHAIQDNPYEHYGYSVKNQPVDVDGTHTNGDRSYGQFAAAVFDGGFDPYLIDSPGFTDALTACRNRVKAKLIERVKDTKVNIAQAIAERDQVARLVGSTAKRFASTVVNLRRLNFRGALDALLGPAPMTAARSREANRLAGLSGVPEQWLALQYGWLPLLGDIDGACKELADTLLDQPPVCRARAKAKQPLDAYSTTRRGSSYPIHPGRKWTRTKAEILGEGFVEYGVSSEFGQAVQRTGIIDPFLLAWELMPWSFVVDWMLPVGSWLESLQFDAGLVFKRGWFSYRFEDRWTAEMEKYLNSSGGWNIRYVGGQGKAECFLFRRELIEGGLAPPPPSFKNPLSLTHMANALSLFAVTFGGKSGSRPIYR